MNFLRRRKATPATAATIWISPSSLNGFFYPWRFGIGTAAFLISLGLVVGPPEKRRRGREMKRRA